MITKEMVNAGEKNRGSHEGHLQGEESRMTESEGIAVADEQVSDTYMEGTIEDEDELNRPAGGEIFLRVFFVNFRLDHLFDSVV